MNSRIQFFLLILTLSTVNIAVAQPLPPLKLGWIGAMTGPIVKYGAAQAAEIAIDDINSSGGINGRRVELIREDSQCKAPLAISALRKLASVDHVTFVLGGHCTPETLAIAPLVDSLGMLSLAAITTSPKLTGVSKFALRISPVSSIVGELTARAAYQAGHRRVGILHEETDYVVPPAEKFKEVFEAQGGRIVDTLGFVTGEQDFRSMGTRFRGLQVDALYIGVQSRDSAQLVLHQLHQSGLKVPTFGNEQLGNGGVSAPAEMAREFDGVIFAEPEFHPESPETAKFIEKFKRRFHVEALPLGIWTAEAYDNVRLLAKVIGECGEDRERVRSCLLNTHNYVGASGIVSLNDLGNGERRYVLKRASASGQVVELPRD